MGSKVHGHVMRHFLALLSMLSDLYPAYYLTDPCTRSIRKESMWDENGSNPRNQTWHIRKKNLCRLLEPTHDIVVFSLVCRKKTTRISLYPPLSEDVFENLETVVAMNIGFDKITWVLEDKNRRLVDWQNTQFFEKVNFRYNHLHYQEKLLEAVNSLPDSDIYLIRSSNRSTKSLGKVKYLIDSAVLEAIVITLINATKGKPMALVEKEENSDEEIADPIYRIKEENDSAARPWNDSDHDSFGDDQLHKKDQYEITNKVHVFQNKNFKKFSPAKGQWFSGYPYVTELMEKGTGPLSGLYIPHYFRSEILKLNTLQEKEGLALCLMMADQTIKFCSGLEEEEEDEEEEEEVVEEDSKTTTRES